MKKSKRLISLLLALVLILTSFLIAPISAESAVVDSKISTLNFWVGGTDTQQGGDLGTVRAHFLTSDSSGAAYLFLPTTMDENNLKVFFNTSSCSITDSSGSHSVSNGQTVSYFSTGINGTYKYTVTLGSSSYSLYVYKSSQVGTIFINTTSGNTANIDYNGSSNHSVGEAGTIMVLDADGNVNYDGELTKIQGRGNGTWDAGKAKYPYNIKLATSTSLLGMAKAKKWVLLANEGEESLLKNWITYDFAEYIGIQYQVVCKPVDVYTNGKYLGNYMLAEKVEIKSNRININDGYEALTYANGTTNADGTITPADFATMSNVTSVLEADSGTKYTTTTAQKEQCDNVGTIKYGTYFTKTTSTGFFPVTTTSYTDLNSPSDVTGGYLYELEISNRWYTENAGFSAYNSQGWVMKSSEYASRAQVDYSYDLLYAMGAAVYNNGVVPSDSVRTTTTSNSVKKTLTNPAPSTQYQGKTWDEILDAKSAVLYYWTQEYFKNMDSSTSSTYFWKDYDSVDTKVHAGPMWDMDNSIGYDSTGTRWGCTWTEPENWYTKEARIYRYRYSDSTTSYSTDAYSPLNFYAALATNCTDFWEMAKEYWYDTVSPAVDILLGEAEDTTGTLHSVEYYATTISDSATMNNVRYGINNGVYDDETIESGMSNWFSTRQEWINGQFGYLDIANAAVDTIADHSFTGSEITPSIHVTYNNSELGVLELEEGEDYQVSFTNNINVGTATVTITGLGRYEGSTKTVNFNIVKNNISTGSLSIYTAAYVGDEIVPTLTDANGLQIVSGVNYTWYANGTQVGSGNTYTTTSSDAGKAITAIATGDNTSTTGTITSNSCQVADQTRPAGSVKNIATFSWKYGDDGTSLQGGKTAGYSATAGVQVDTAKITASVNGVDKAKLEWSGSDSFTRTDGTSGQQPIIKPSTTTPWGEYPYFDTTFSTIGYSNITYQCDLGATSKGAADYALMYSTDGQTFSYITNEEFYFDITDKKTMKDAFDVTLPDDANNKETVIVRVIVMDEYTLDGNDTLFTTSNTSGKIAINEVYVDGIKDNDVTGLNAPTIVSSSNSLYSEDTISITDNNEGSAIYFTLTDERGNTSETYTYSEAFAPFKLVNATTLTVTAWSEEGIYVSEVATKTFNSNGDAIARFEYSSTCTNIINGEVPANGGEYGESSKMTMVASGTTQYVPMYNTSHKAFALSPDDGLVWTSDSGVYFELSTTGYSNIKISCDAYTTSSGPKNIALQYSTDKTTWSLVQRNITLSANGQLETLLDMKEISAISNQSKIYVRLVPDTNSTNGGDTLFNNASKGNLYINNIVFSGTPNGDLKKPYTNKTTNYFGTGTIKYYTSDTSASMFYTVVCEDGTTLQNVATYPETGIKISDMQGFNPMYNGGYTVTVWTTEDEDQSVANVRTYYYKGDTVSTFSYGSTKFDNNINADGTSLNATKGTGSLAMYPNGTTAATMTYTSSYGVKVSATADNTWTATKNLDTASGNGYWLIQTSTKGYTNLTLSLDQVSSSKGARDWGVAYSLDGTNYTYIANSNSRSVESNQPMSTYSNLTLPAALDNQENVYIKIFINGGENVAGYELDDEINSTGKGNIGINNIEICGISSSATMVFTTTVLETLSSSEGTTAVSNISVKVDGTVVGTTDAAGNITVSLEAGEHEVVFENGKFTRTINIYAQNKTVNVPLVVIDLNNDGYINARDLALISKLTDQTTAAYYETIFDELLNVSANTIQYA